MSTKRKIVTWVAGPAGLALAACAFGVFLLYLLQDRMVYRVQRYGPDAAVGEPGERPIVELPYRTMSGRQIAFYLAPKNGHAPSRVWIMFGGNGAAILDYRETVPEQPALAQDGFLLVDYPGYGYNAGKPSAPAIAEGASGAMGALAQRLGVPDKTVYSRTGVFGHSLGAGAALEFAEAHQEIRRIVLVSPFTSLYAVGFDRVGPAALFLHHNFDNAAVLRKLSERNPRPSVTILHGDQDQVVPVTMSRTLASENKWLAYHELRGYEHGRIVGEAAPQIAAAMAQMEGASPRATALPGYGNEISKVPNSAE